MSGAAAEAAGQIYVALLRGINVGGKNRLPMRALVEALSAAGFRRVQSYIQSGNLVFEAGADQEAALPARLSELIATRFGLEVPVVVFAAPALRALVSRNPYLSGELRDPSRLLVAFLAEQPSPEALARLDPARSPPDRFTAHGRAIFLECPEGFGRSKLTTAYFDSKLQTQSTIRNWKTTLRLLELCEAALCP